MFCFLISQPSIAVSSQVLTEAGLIAGGDMTPEAALSKLSYVLAKKDLSLDAKKKVFAFNPQVPFMCVCEWLLPISVFLFVTLCSWWLRTSAVRWIWTLQTPIRVWVTADSSRSSPNPWVSAAKRWGTRAALFYFTEIADFFQTPGFDRDVLSLNIWPCPQELAAIRDALMPPLACAAAKIGDIEALEALKEMVSPPIMASLNTWIHTGKRKKKSPLGCLFALGWVRFFRRGKRMSLFLFWEQNLFLPLVGAWRNNSKYK